MGVSRAAVTIRSKLQAIFFKLGCFSQRHSWAVLGVGFAILIGLSVGIINAKIETDVEKLWMEVGGRLENELQYTRDSLGEGSGQTNELLIHAPNGDEENILSVESLQQHLKVVQKAIDVKVEVFGRSWSHSDLCYVPEIPSFNVDLVDEIIAAIVPCLIVSPLDCFWDGAKLLKLRGPIPLGLSSTDFEWIRLNPSRLLGLLDTFNIEGADEIKKLFREAGITSGYVNKPCLDPVEKDCSETAPNKNAKKPNVSEVLSGGCRGFATEFMQWAEEMIIGGPEKNNVTLTSAKALQTILVLTGPQGLYTRWADNAKDIRTEWSIDSARQVLETWQREFTKIINSDIDETETFSVLAFDSSSITDLLHEFSNTSATKVALGYVLMLVYACITLRRWCDLINSHSALGFAGVLLVTLSVSAGLGLCALCGVPFNAASTQVLPFLALGLGVDDMFLLAHTYAFQTQGKDVQRKDEVGYCLCTIGVSVFLTSFNNMLAFFMAAIIPIPALRYFAIQAAVVVIFNFLGVIIIFPALIALDLRRRKGGRYDILCCIQRGYPSGGTLSTDVVALSGQNVATTELNNYGGLPSSQSYNGGVLLNTKSDPNYPMVVVNQYVDQSVRHPTNEFYSNQFGGVNSVVIAKGGQPKGGQSCEGLYRVLSLSHFATAYYGPSLQRTPVKVVVVVLFAGLLAAGIYGSLIVQEGLDLTDVVPRESIAHKFVEAQFKYFSFYPMALVTQSDFDYASQQKTLFSYYDSFKEIPQIIRIPGSDELPRFWMMYFRDWLNGLQEDFDKDWTRNAITFSGWYGNASNTGVIAYKLLAQTGNGNETDRSQVRNFKLVNDDGIIRPEVFYKALTVWIDRDILGYAFSQADIRPETSNWTNIRSRQDDNALQVPTAKPITFAKINFNLIGLQETKDFVEVIKNVRAICDKFSEKGLPNYPSGVPFTFWEQYISLGAQILTAIGVALVVSFLVMAAMLFNICAAAIIVIVLLMITVEVYGFMGLAGIKLSAVPAVTLILSVGVGVEFTVHLCIAFLTSRGNRNERMQTAIEHVFVPIVDGAISTLLGVVMLAGSEFEFIVRYFFNLLVALIVTGTLNGLLFLPVLLSLVGPRTVAEEIITPSTTTSMASQNQPSQTSPAESALNVLEGEGNDLRSITSDEDSKANGQGANGAETEPSGPDADKSKDPEHGSLMERAFQGIKHGAQVEPANGGSENEGVVLEDRLTNA